MLKDVTEAVTAHKTQKIQPPPQPEEEKTVINIRTPPKEPKSSEINSSLNKSALLDAIAAKR